MQVWRGADVVALVAGKHRNLPDDAVTLMMPDGMFHHSSDTVKDWSSSHVLHHEPSQVMMITSILHSSIEKFRTQVESYQFFLHLQACASTT
jgi:hypothetical protein